MTAGLTLSVGASPGHHTLSAGSLPDFGHRGYTKDLGFSIELWIEGHEDARTGDVLFATTPAQSSESALALR